MEKFFLIKIGVVSYAKLHFGWFDDFIRYKIIPLVIFVVVLFFFFVFLKFGVYTCTCSTILFYIHCKYVAHSLCYTRTITPTFDHQFIQCSIFYYHTRKTRWLIYICDIRSLRFGSFSNWIMNFFLCSDGM